MDRSSTLLSEVLENLTAVYSYLANDLAKEKLSSTNKKNRNLFIQRLDGLINKIKIANESGPPTPNEPRPPPLPASQNRPPPPISKAPPIPPTIDSDEGGEVYEVPDTDNNAQASTEYSSFLPLTTEDEPQEDYLAMEADQREEIDDETYEDPNQTLKDQEPGLYEDPVNNPQPQIPPSPTCTSMGGYIDPVLLKVSDEDKRNSLVPEHLICDWADVYDSSIVNKKKEKIKPSKLSNILVKGWLEKLGGRNHNNWQKRYCVLAAMFMYFYEKESSSTYNNRIPIPGFLAIASEELTRSKRSLYAFKLSSTESSGGKSKDYYFRAKTEAERDQWVTVVRNIFQQGRAVLEKKKSQTLPTFHNSNSVKNNMPNLTISSSVSEEPEQENYEAITPADIIEEDDDQEEYIDVSQANEAIAEDPDSQEEYVEIRPGEQLEEEPQEDYVEPTEIRQTLSRQTTSTSSLVSPPLPPPPSSSIKNQPLPPPPPTNDSTAPSVTQQPLPAIPPPRHPDPIVDTEKVYLQSQNGMQYDKVYVILWDFEGTDSDELRAKRGDLVMVTEPNKSQEWWFGEILAQDCSRKLGQSGLFPSSYCSIAFEPAV